MIAFAHDAAWGGWGRAVCTEDGPVASSHIELGGRTWRWDAMWIELDTGGHAAFAEHAAQLARDRGDVPRFVVEVSPPNAKRRGRDGKPRNQVQTSYAMGQATGPILLDGVRPGWAYPWPVPPRMWRGWLGWPAGGDAKSACISVCRAEGWGHHIQPWGNDPRGAAGDVAEAIVMGVWACRNAAKAPKGPARWRGVCPPR